MAASAPLHWGSSAPTTSMLPEAGQRFHIGSLATGSLQASAMCMEVTLMRDRSGQVSQDTQGASSDILAFTGLASIFYSEGKEPLCQIPPFLTRV